VAGLITPRLRAEFRLRRLDLVSQRPEGDDEVLQTDIRDVPAVA
jgi:hypothetical protein